MDPEQLAALEEDPLRPRSIQAEESLHVPPLVGQVAVERRAQPDET